MKKVLKSILIVFLALILILGGYVAYVFLAYHRIGNTELAVTNDPKVKNQVLSVSGRTYTVLSYNIGFGAYESDYGFFMDGGDQSWAWSRERLDANLKEIGKTLSGETNWGLPNERSFPPDFILVQEVDIDSTRSYHVDERDYLVGALSDLPDNYHYDYTFAQNYDSPFLCYPITQPHGASRSGLMTFSMCEITSAERVELPVETGVTKLLDLDRCYSKSRIGVEDGKEFVLYNLHLSAYTSDGTIATEQLKLVLEDMDKEYARGNYCVAGGDFNKDLLGNSADYFGASDKEYTWAQPIPEGMLDAYPVSLIAPIDEQNPVPSCRNADGPYHEGQYVLTIDGFLVTDNITVYSSQVLDTGFQNSDHNPVKMQFRLIENHGETLNILDKDTFYQIDENSTLAQTSFDLDGDGENEEVVLGFGPTSGVYTVRLAAYKDGAPAYGETFLIPPGKDYAFEERGGKLYLGFTYADQQDSTQTGEFQVSLSGNRIVLTSDDEDLYAWY